MGDSSHNADSCYNGDATRRVRGSAGQYPAGYPEGKRESTSGVARDTSSVCALRDDRDANDARERLTFSAASAAVHVGAIGACSGWPPPPMRSTSPGRVPALRRRRHRPADHDRPRAGVLSAGCVLEDHGVRRGVPDRGRRRDVQTVWGPARRGFVPFPVPSRWTSCVRPRGLDGHIGSICANTARRQNGNPHVGHGG